MALFFHMHSHFDWSRYCWCIEGARRLDTLHSNTNGGGSGGTDDPSSAAVSSYGECYAAEAFEGLGGYPAPLLLSQARTTVPTKSWDRKGRLSIRHCVARRRSG